MAEYNYARNEKGIVFDIEQLDKIARYENNNHFFCLVCGQPMEAVLGNVREHYFRHQNSEAEKNCNKEAYKETVLHILGKRRFIKLLEQHKENGKPLFLGFGQRCVCDKNPCPYGKTNQCSELNDEKFEIYPTFNQCYEETWDRIYRPDILLKSSNGKQLYVEIFVSHPCSEQKKASGIPIIEISLQNENDLNLISDDSFAVVDNPKIKFYNNPNSSKFISIDCNYELKSILDEREKHVDDVKDVFKKHFQWLEKIPYQMDYNCLEKRCPYLPIWGCSYKEIKHINVKKDLPIIDDNGTENRLILKNEYGKSLIIDFVESFCEKEEYENGRPVAQYMIKDVLGGRYDRVKCFNIPFSKEKPCHHQKYIFAYLLFDNSLKIEKKSLEKLYLFYIKNKVDIKDYVLMEEECLRKRIQENEIIDELRFNDKLNKVVADFFASHYDSVKNCSQCFHMKIVSDDNAANDCVCCWREKRQKIVPYTTAMFCKYYEPIILEQVKKDCWRNVIEEMYGTMRFK